MIRKKQVLLAVIGAIALGSVIYVGYNKVYEAMTAVRVQEKVKPICDLEEITRIEFKGDTLVTLQKQGDLWQNTNYAYLNYDQERLKEWVTLLQTGQTVEVVKNAESEKDYGISDASMMITLFDANNQSETYRIGQYIKADNKLYLKCNEDNDISVVAGELAENLCVLPNEFVIYDDLLQIEQVQKMACTQGDKTYQVVEEAGSWYLKDYYKMPCVLTAEAMTDWIEQIKALQFESYVGTFEDLADYGLDQPNESLIINDTTHLNIGEKVNGQYYVCFADSKDVYTLSQKTYNALTDFTQLDWIDRQLMHVNLEDLASITLVNPQGEFVLTINEQAVPQDEVVADKQDETGATLGMEETTETTTSPKETPSDATNALQTDKEEVQPEGIPKEQGIAATLNDIELNQIEAEEWLDMIQANIYVEALLQNPQIEQKEARKAECTIHYMLRNGETIQIEFIPYDINYYILRYNDTIEFAVNKEKVTKLFSQLSHFVNKSNTK